MTCTSFEVKRDAYTFWYTIQVARIGKSDVFWLKYSLGKWKLTKIYFIRKSDLDTVVGQTSVSINGKMEEEIPSHRWDYHRVFPSMKEFY